MSKPLNILFFFPDQHRSDWLGANDSLPLRTPQLDRLSAEGVRFRNAYCDSPLCAPSRAALAAGRGYDRCGVVNNRQDYPLDQPTYYQSLRDVGYRVAGVGKFDLAKDLLDWEVDGTRRLDDWGFTEGIDNEGKFDGSRSYRQNERRPKGPYLAFLAERGLADDYVAEHTREKMKPTMGAYTTCLPDDAYCDNWVAENGLTFLREFPADTPWHLVINFTGPHSPMDVTASMRARWEDVEFPPPHANDNPDREGLLRNRQNYAAMIENIDRQVGRFLDLVAERGEADRTLVIYASDHGEMLGDHGRWGKNSWREPSIGVPLIVAGPGVARGRACDCLVSIHDLAGTITDYAGAAPVPGNEAISLRGILGGGPDVHRDHIITGLNDWRTVFDGRRKLVTGCDDGPILCDLVEDPWEDRNLAAEHPEVVERMGRLIGG